MAATNGSISVAHAPSLHIPDFSRYTDRYVFVKIPLVITTITDYQLSLINEVIRDLTIPWWFSSPHNVSAKARSR